MSDEPVAATPAATDTTATTPATPAAASAAAPKPNGKKKPGVIEIPEKSFRDRVNRDAAAQIRREFGMSKEDALAIIKAHGQGAAAAATPAPGSGGQPTAAQTDAVASEAMRKLQQENIRLKARAENERRRAESEKIKRQKEVQRLKDRQFEAELAAEAASLGIVDPQRASFATQMFADAVKAGKATDSRPFFEGLKKSHTWLFSAAQAAPTVVDIPVTTAPPASLQPGEEKPRPATAGQGGAPGKSVDAMEGHEFGAHLKSRYGFTPGM